MGKLLIQLLARKRAGKSNTAFQQAKQQQQKGEKA
jgi:hypothetical protein